MKISARQNARLVLRLEALLRANGLSKRSLANQTGVSIGAIRNFGKTTQGPTLSTMLAIAQGLNLNSLDELLGPSAAFAMIHQEDLDQAVGEMHADNIAVIGLSVK